MRGINSWHGIGNLGADPDVRYSAAGNAVTKFRMGINEEWRDKQSGEKQQRTEWVRVTCFGKLAEIAGEHLKSGSPVYVKGAVRTSEYEKNGERRFSTEIVADELRMLGGRPQTDNNTSGGTGSQSGQNQADDFDIPF